MSPEVTINEELPAIMDIEVPMDLSVSSEGAPMILPGTTPSSSRYTRDKAQVPLFCLDFKLFHVFD